MTTDDLGSPRVVTDQFGQVVARHDYMPFGEEVLAGVGGRTSAQGYGGDDEIRKKFTGYERDDESGLDYAQARYFKPTHGRFTSVDPLTASANIKNPQTLNRYTYALNSPYKFVDPLGLSPCGISGGPGNAPGRTCTQADDWDTSFGAESARAEAAHDERVNNAFDAANANAAIARGDQATAKRICDANTNIECKKSDSTVTVEATVMSPIPPPPPPGNSGISVIVWANNTFSTRVLGHVSYIIDGVSWSFDNKGFHRDDNPLNYISESSQSSAGVQYDLDFGSKVINTKFKNLILVAYQGKNAYYTGINNCSSGFVRAINVIAKDLGVKSYTGSGTPAGVQNYINDVLKPRILVKELVLLKTKP